MKGPAWWGVALWWSVAAHGTCGADTNTVPPSVANDELGSGLPKWEAGLFGAGARLPHYRGSDEYRTYAFPMPYVLYRGEVIQVEREGMRGFFYKGPRLETDLSLGGNPPAHGEDEARRGMPELDPLLELGPAVRGFLYRGRRLASLYVEAAVREVVAVDVKDFAVRDEGLRAVLRLVASRYSPNPESPWSCGGSVGMEFTDRRYNSYFYDVAEDQVLADREAYRSRAGYGGFNTAGSVTRRLRPGLSLSIYARWDNLDGAVYEDSPLVKTHDNIVVGAAIVWRLAASTKRVKGQ